MYTQTSYRSKMSGFCSSGNQWQRATNIHKGVLHPFNETQILNYIRYYTSVSVPLQTPQSTAQRHQVFNNYELKPAILTGHYLLALSYSISFVKMLKQHEAKYQFTPVKDRYIGDK